MDIRYLEKVLGLSAKVNYIQRRPAMSVPTIAPYFPFRRIKIVKQSLLSDISEARVHVEPDKRSHLSLLREKGHSNSQLDPTHDTGSELGCNTGVDNLSISEALLFSMSPYQYREFRFVSSLLTGNPSSGALHSSAMSVHDGKRSCQTCETGLENR